jgi:hypothetical protein
MSNTGGGAPLVALFAAQAATRAAIWRRHRGTAFAAAAHARLAQRRREIRSLTEQDHDASRHATRHGLRVPALGVGLLLVLLAAVGAMSLELVAQRFVSVEFRRRHNDAAAAIFSIIGVTFAVLLAFVAMLAWEGFNKAKAATYAEASAIYDLYNASVGITGGDAPSLRIDIISYVDVVITAEWPAQAEGKVVDKAAEYLNKLNSTAIGFKPPSLADGNLHALLLQSLSRLGDARQQRLLAAETTVPAVVWIVTIIGGGLTIAFSSFLGVPSLEMHLAMSAALAISGAPVLILIVALSNPFRGDFRVSTLPFDRVLTQIQGR